MSLIRKHWKFIPILSLAVLLTGCLGDDDSTPAATPAAATLGGTAATGAPIDGGVVTLKCATGTATDPETNDDGTWEVPLAGLTLPCAVEVSGGNLPVGQVYHSVALQAGTVNITPLTDLVVANLAGQAPSTWFAGLDANAFQLITANAVNAALGNVRGALGLAALNGVDPLTVGFNAASGNAHDDILEALKLALTAAGTTYPNLLNAAQNPTITPPAGLATALETNHQRFLRQPPTVSGFSPASGAAGTTVTITGTNFDPDPFHMLVTFADNVPATVTSATATQLVVTVPAGASTGAIKVTNGLTQREVSSAASFTVTSSGGGGGGGASTWTQRSSGTAYTLDSVAYGNGLFVAGGFGNTIISSTDGITWTSRSSTSDAKPDANYYQVNGLAWSASTNRFIAVGDRTGVNNSIPPLLATSPDGITWTRASLASGTYIGAKLTDITSDSTGITVVGPGYIFHSADGVAWTTELPDGIGSANLSGVASSGTVRVAVGYDNAMTPAALIYISNNRGAWTRVTAPTGFAPNDVTWNGSVFVIVGSSAPLQVGVTPKIATSSDGQTWTLQTLPSAIASSSYQLEGVNWDGTRFIALGSPYAFVSERLILTSTDGVTWAVDQQITTGNGMKFLSSVASNGTRAVAVGDTVFTKDF